MSASVQPAAGTNSWRLIVIAAVTVLAVGIGVAAGSTLLNSRASGAGAAAVYVPADAPMYFEMRLEPSTQQDAALREILGRFPEIEGIDSSAPLYDQLTARLDELLAEESVDLSWSDDVAPWFDGRIGVAVTDIGLESIAQPADPMSPPPMPDVVVLVGVTDPTEAQAAIDRIISEAGSDGISLTDTVHNGVTIRSSDAPNAGAYAVTDDTLLLAESSGPIEDALDVEAAGSATLREEVAPYVAQLPGDWIGFAYYDLTELMTESFAEAAAASPEMAEMAEAFAGLYEHQSLRGAMAFSAEGDRFLADAAAVPPSGPFAVENRDRGLAAEVPAEALYFSEGGNLGASMAAVLEPLAEAMAQAPGGEDPLAMIEAALGGDLEEVVEWIGDGAVTVGWDGAQPYGGLVLVPTDMDAAERRLNQLIGFAELAVMDPTIGLNVTEEEIASETVTTISWVDQSGAASELLPIERPGLAVQITVTDDRAIIGFGDTFVTRALELDAADSLANEPRYRDAIADFGGAENAGVTWLDLTGTRLALEDTVLSFAEAMGGDYEGEIKPWLVPFDRLVTVTRLEGDLLLQRSGLLFE